jgi:hypothetical protein
VTNIIGIALGTLFRFWSYRKFVFVGMRVEGPMAGTELDPVALDPVELDPTGSG